MEPQLLAQLGDPQLLVLIVEGLQDIKGAVDGLNDIF
jgi:hypothetical protein